MARRLHSSLDGLDLHGSKIEFITGSPQGVILSPVEGKVLCDKTTKTLYISNETNSTNWSPILGFSKRIFPDFEQYNNRLITTFNTSLYLKYSADLVFLDDSGNVYSCELKLIHNGTGLVDLINQTNILQIGGNLYDRLIVNFNYTFENFGQNQIIKIFCTVKIQNENFENFANVSLRILEYFI